MRGHGAERGGGADRQPRARVAAHADELADAAQADQRFRLELATLHVGKQIRAAGNEHGVRAAVGEIPDGIIDRARRHVIERGKPNHCNECREAGSGRGWPDIEGWWLRSIECREAGSGRGWPAREGWWRRAPQRLLMSANPQMDGRQSPRRARRTRIPPRSAP